MEYPFRSKLITSLYSAFICSSLFSKRLEHLGDALFLLFHVRVNIEIKGCCDVGMTEQYAYCLVVAVAFNAACSKAVVRIVTINQVKQELNATSKICRTDFTQWVRILKRRLSPIVLESWITSMTVLRNACWHHSRVWNKVSSIMPVSPRRIAHYTNRPTSYTLG